MVCIYSIFTLTMAELVFYVAYSYSVYMVGIDICIAYVEYKIYIVYVVYYVYCMYHICGICSIY